MEITSRLTAIFLAIILLPLLVIIALISLIIQGFQLYLFNLALGRISKI